MENLNKFKSNYWIQLKTLWQKVKLLMMSNFCFGQNIFNSCLPQRRLKTIVCGEGLKASDILRSMAGFLIICLPYTKHTDRSRNSFFFHNYFKIAYCRFVKITCIWKSVTDVNQLNVLLVIKKWYKRCVMYYISANNKLFPYNY